MVFKVLPVVFEGLTARVLHSTQQRGEQGVRESAVVHHAHNKNIIGGE